MSGPEVLVVRHAQTEWSLARRHTGRTDVPLTDAGRAAARDLGRRLAGFTFTRVLTSPARRARETCELCGLADQAQVLPELWEWNYGAYEGLTMDEIQQLEPGWSVWRDGSPEGESPAEVGARADRVIAEVGELDGAVAVFSHGHFLRVLAARWISLEPAQGARFALFPAALGLLTHERATRVIGRWNEVS